MDIFGYLGLLFIIIVLYAIIKTEIESWQFDNAREKRGREGKDEFRIKIFKGKTFKGWITLSEKLKIEGWWGRGNIILSVLGLIKSFSENIEYENIMRVSVHGENDKLLLEIEFKKYSEKQVLQFGAIVPGDVNLIQTSINNRITEIGRKAEIKTLMHARYKSGNFSEISPTDFEKVIQELFTYMGYYVTRVGGSGDGGVDLMCESKAFNEKLIVQCKRYAGKVSVGVVRDFYGALIHEKVNKGFIITTSDFTKDAQYWARGKPIELVNGERLKDLMMTYYK